LETERHPIRGGLAGTGTGRAGRSLRCDSRSLRGTSSREPPAEVELALWFHDAIDPRATDNDQRSAEWAAHELESAAATAGVIAAVRALILATRHDAIPNGGDEQILTDIDLAVLGA
jgi:predicted metal-dependent HD superfamily phosphohydrolase